MVAIDRLASMSRLSPPTYPPAPVARSEAALAAVSTSLTRITTDPV
jgi:hypothetical protein